MNGDTTLVHSFVDRLSEKLPHRTGSNDLRRDELVILTRSTLFDVSLTSSFVVILDALLSLLEDLRGSKPIHNHPTHILNSELYILELLAECCTANWDHVHASRGVPTTVPKTGKANTTDSGAASTHSGSTSYTKTSASGKKGLFEDETETRRECRRRSLAPYPLDERLVQRIIETIKFFLTPFPEDHAIDPASILDDGSYRIANIDKRITTSGSGSTGSSSSGSGLKDNSKLLGEKSTEVEVYLRDIMEFVSASNWSYVFELLRTTFRRLVATFSAPGSAQQLDLADENSSLVTIRLIEYFMVDGHKLSLVLQEICGAFLHLRRQYQNTVAIVIPLLITRWLENNPAEFVDVHTRQKKLDGGADTLFDMANSMQENNGRRKTMIWHFQGSLILLIPDVFEVCANMREAKSQALIKKAAFLDGLRKHIRSRTYMIREAAAYCLLTMLRAARHITATDDAALFSYALDVQHEIREVVFQKPSSPNETVFDKYFDDLTPLCIDINAPASFKLACFEACTHFAAQPNAEDYVRIYDLVAPFIRLQLQAVQLSNPAPQKVIQPLGTTSSVDLVCSILSFLKLRPEAIFANMPQDTSQYDKFFETVFGDFVSCLATDESRIRASASPVGQGLMTEPVIALLKESLRAGSVPYHVRFWQSTSLILYTMASKVMELGFTGKGAKSIIGFIHDYIEKRLTLHKSDLQPGVAEKRGDIDEDAMTSSALEVVFLVCLCSADLELCGNVTRCLALFCEEGQYCSSSTDFTRSPTSMLRNLDCYLELCAQNFRFTGLVAFQKRMRSILTRMSRPTMGILTAWETVFKKWLPISNKLSTSRSADQMDEKMLVEWRNYSGFLASLGGCCIADQASKLEDVDIAGLRWIDRLSPNGVDDTLLMQYISLSIRLLTCSNVRVRHATQEVLSTELSPALHMQLFKALEAELGIMFDAPRGPSTVQFTFAEQAASLLKTIVERLGNTAELGTSLSIDLGALTLNFARFLNSEEPTKETMIIKVKVCQLCEIVTRKKELLNLRHDVRIRNQLLELIFGWIARPVSPRADNNSVQLNSGRVDEMVRLQRDLDRASLKALSDLTFRLPLQPAEGQSDAETSDMKSNMFHTYFNRFLSLLNYESTDLAKREVHFGPLNREDTPSTPEMAITALSNLLSANIDVGLKHSLVIGYHEDLSIRTAFVQVLCNILTQGTEFNNLSDAAVTEKYDELLELLLGDMSLTIALCDACPSLDVDEMTIALLNIFDSRGMGFVLLRALVDHEVETTENEAELLRRNCVATKMLSVYAKWKGSAYLKTTLQKVLERLIMSSEDLDLELDPARTASPEELQRNALQLRHVTKVFIDDICNSASHVPVSFRKICNIISSSVQARFPDAKFTAVGAFIFLRFFCPAIVAPDAEGLINSTPTKDMRRGLLLIAKVVQNLANNVLFGAKEPYMFPLNDFLTQNIYRVTTFLREISAPPKINDSPTETESFDFGSCVALHRFLYDHWDLVRQKLLAQGRKSSVHSPSDVSKGKLPILDALRGLITNLGPPPTDVSWNRPMISANDPPSYSRFQHFMLRNAGRSTETVVSSRAVYDGGESKDGLSMICIILRNIDMEGTDYDLLLYCYLKIASRMWHRPFGILIDATCYNGQNEPQDALFRKLDLLTPNELSKQLSRVYVYNMNSAFRKCFRRILRLSARSESSAFHPKNVEYHLIGSLQDLQQHFHLSQLHLPKETISVVTDTRFVFQPVTRLSKTKGKIEVVIKVGSQFVQVTTTNKQEVVPGLKLNATVNDIFRLSEVDEAPTSIQTEDDSAFGIRTDNGKIVMYFTSPRKFDVLQAIQGAKAKHGKDAKVLKAYERLIRPQDVPGTLLNIAFTNMASLEPVLRLASYNLLCALCRTFKFAADSRFLSTGELCVPLNPSQFIIGISSQLADVEPQLTHDFLNEFFVGWESFPWQQRPLSLAYMAPWLPSLRTNVLAMESDPEKAREKVAAISRKLIEVACSDLSLSTTLEQSVWPRICQDELHTEIFLDELIKAALTFGVDEDRTEALASILASLECITARGKLISRLRKALNRTSLRPTRHLPENSVWNELCVLLTLCLSMSFDSGIQSQLYLPELFHIITMLANTGTLKARASVHKLLVNTVHAMCTKFPLEEAKLSRLRAILISLSEPRNGMFFKPPRHSRDGGSSISQSHDGRNEALDSTEAIANLLSEITIIAAPSVDMSNSWRARWMSLVASTAFQSNPAIQPRAFTVMGCLAREDVDDDLLYQVLVALRSSINRFMEDNDSEMLISIVTSLTKMMEKLPAASRYGLQLFWLAMALVRLVPLGLFNCATRFLEAVLSNINTSGEFQGGRMVAVLLQGRLPLEDPAVELDEIYGVHFSMDNFHYAVCACLVKGLTDNATKAIALRVLSTFLEIATGSMADGARFPEDLTCLPYLSMVLSRAVTSEETKEILWLAGMNIDGKDTPEDFHALMNYSAVKDKDLLLNAAISIVDFRYLEDNVQHRCLSWLDRLAIQRPTIILHLYGPVSSILEDVLLSCQNATTLEAAHKLMRSMTSNPKLSSGVDTVEMLEDVLEDIGFSGLWRSSTFLAYNEQDRQCAILTDRVIELIIA